MDSVVAQDWRETTIGEVVEFYDRQRIPLSGKQRKERQGPYPYYGASGVIDHIDDYIFDGRYILIAEDGENLNSRKLPVAFFAEGKFWVNNHAHIIKAIPGVADDDFICAWFAQANISGYITGAAQPKLSQANLKRISLRLPPYTVQKKIAAILSAYDDLIENNLRRIKILEEMAQNLYREWFVKFRFPGHEKVRMVDSPLGKIPEGWEATTVGAVTSYINRGVAPKYDDSSSSLVINQKCIRDHKLNMALARKHRSRVVDEKFVRFGDVLINSTGVGTLGRVSQVYEELDDVTVDTHVSIVRPSSAGDIDFLGVALIELESYFESLGAGATGQTELRRDRIGETELVFPPVKLRRQFSEQVFPSRKLAINFATRNEVLRQTRDLLLPKLISGELDVSELEIDTDKEAA